jgi:hypothetical protein
MKGWVKALSLYLQQARLSNEIKNYYQTNANIVGLGTVQRPNINGSVRNLEAI